MIRVAAKVNLLVQEKPNALMDNVQTRKVVNTAAVFTGKLLEELI